MTPAQVNLTKDAVTEMRTVSVAAPAPHDAQSLSDLLIQNDIHYGLTDLTDLSATGFSRAGLAAIANLAKTFRPTGSVESHQSSNATLSRDIAGEIIRRWKGRDAGSLSQSDCDELKMAITDWFAAQRRARLHAVPCTITSFPAPVFAVGPVNFVHVHDFPSERFGVVREQFWPEPTPESRSKIIFSIGRAFAASTGLTPSVGRRARFG